MTTQDVRIGKLQHLASGLAGAVVLLGLGVLFGWWLGIPLLKSVLPGSPTLKANTALCFVLTGTSLFLLAPGRLDKGWKKWTSTACASGAVLLATLTLLQYLLDWDLRIDELLAKDLPISPATSHPGRMAPYTALCFLLFGVALLTLEVKTKLVGWPAQHFAGRRFSTMDLTLAMDLGQRAAIAVDNARLYHEAREAVRTREEVLAVVSHDLKNPLGTISLSANLLTRAAPEGEPGTRIRRHADTIQRYGGLFPKRRENPLINPSYGQG